MVLNEIFSYKIGTIQTKNGNNLRVAYIDPKESENTFNVKDKLKSYGAHWHNTAKWWYWPLGKNPEYVIQNQVRPCVEELSVIEDGGNSTRKVANIIDELIKKVKSASIPSNVVNATSKDDILSSLENFKADLVKITSDEEFKRMMEPIIKFRNASGYQYSLLNTILILVQDPDATLVKSRSAWRELNKDIKPDAKPIMLWYPKGKRAYTPEEQELIKKDFLKKKKVDSIEQLTPGDKERLKKELNRTVAETFDLGPYWFDFRFTTQMPNTEDIVGNPSNNIQWFDDEGDETPELIKKIDATLKVIEDEGISLSFTDDLGGARGVSKSGTIEILKNQPKNAGMLNTIIHEFAHEILHQKYLQSRNEEMKAYFVGTKDGRGKVEQQAELCAWIVMRSFGYDMRTNINYVGIWGLNQDNAVQVFDSVSRVATFISQKIIHKEQENTKMTESKRYIKENNIPSGEEIANMVGCGKVYKQAKKRQMQKQMTNENVIRLSESDLKELIKESVNRILKEEIKTVLIYPHTISAYQAAELAKSENLDEEYEAAKMWFEEVAEYREFEPEIMPKYNRFICHIDKIGADLYYDYGADYYFCVEQ
jgi:hypothetical protein